MIPADEGDPARARDAADDGESRGDRATSDGDRVDDDLLRARRAVARRHVEAMRR